MASSKWDGFDCLGFDLETTGIDTQTDRIVQAALVRIREGHRPEIAQYLVDPGIEIPAEATAVHGITTAKAQAEATHTVDQMLFEITGRLALAMGHGIPVVGMNLSYDLTLLEAENRRHGIDTLTSRLGNGMVQPVIDVLVLDKFADPYRKGGRKLEQLCATYGVRHVGAHDAGGDALAACRLWPRVMAKHARKFGGQTVGSLHQSQVGWRKSQMDSLRAYFDKNGTQHDGCCGEWPLHQACLPTAVGGQA